MNEQNNINLIQEAKSETTSGDRLKKLAALNEDFAEIVASNVAAPPELLKELASHHKKALRKAVTSNPNTPTEALLKLGEFFPQELLNNPVFNLLPLDDLKFLEKIPINTLSVLLEQSNVPKFLSKHAINHQNEKIRKLSQMQVTISSEMREKWHELAEKEIKETELFWWHSKYYRQNGYSFDLTVDECELYFLSYLLEFIPNILLKNKHLLMFIILNPCTLQTMIKNIFNQKKDLVCENLIDRRYNYKLVKSKLVDNPDLPAEILEKLLKNEDLTNYIVMNPHTPKNIIRRLASSDDSLIRNLAEKAINKLEENITVDLKTDRVHQKHNQSISEIESNITSQNQKNRIEIAQNPYIPTNLLNKLAIHESYLIEKSETIISGIGIIEEQEGLPINEERLVLYKILQNPQCTLEIKKTIFKNLAKSKTPSFSRVALFLSNYAESFVLAENSNSISWLERYAIAQNPKTPENNLKQLAQDGNRIVRATAKESLQKYHQPLLSS